MKTNPIPSEKKSRYCSASSRGRLDSFVLSIYKYLAALLLWIYPKRCSAPKYLQKINSPEAMKVQRTETFF
ncbi:MAG: hypothetical protein C0397_15240 [Odoribacter sp.]|nr:hypothetical protein [Odoribacter sp.]